MKDCTGREIEAGDEVAFSVGTALLTGTVVEFKTRRSRYYADTNPYARIKLTVPEQKGGRWQMNEVAQSWERADFTLNHFRNVAESSRIVILKSLDNFDE
jgi:hypothetical protein